jgi:uncharacterized RDD family membrane protein YckC
MVLTCPHCGFSQDVPAENIPAGTNRATCPCCGQAFHLQATEPAEPDTATMAGTPDGPPVPHTELRSPSLEAPGMETASHPPYAGFWLRVAAAMIDAILVGIAKVTLSILLGGVSGVFNSVWQAPAAMPGLLLTWLFSSAIGMAYYVVFTGSCGQTPGKMALYIKVVRSDGSDMTYGRAALREVPGKFLSGILLGIGYLMVVFDERKQGLHDKLAESCVIRL